VSAPRCRRYHPVWLTHSQMDLLESLCDQQKQDGSYWGNREQFAKRLADTAFALTAATCNCIDEMERPK